MMAINPKYQIHTAENRRFLEEMRKELFSFGHGFPSPGGSTYYLGDDGTPMKEKNRETYATARMEHVYSLGVFLDYPGSRQLAAEAIRGLTQELQDPVNGGWYAGLTADNAIVPNKLCYAHAFVILAASSGVLADIPGAAQLLEDALKVYDQHFWDEKEGLSCDTWNTEFTILDPYRGLNANMHTVEAFLAASDVTGDERYRTRSGRIIRRVLGWASANQWRIPEHYSDTWEPQPECNKDRPDDAFKPYGATPGHGIEWARLILQWALSSFHNNQDAAPYIEASENLFLTAVSDAWNVDGAPGICYTTDWDGKPVVHDRMHWTLAEGINTSAALYHVTGKQRYADQYYTFMEYLDDKVLDHKHGSWFHQLDRFNRPMTSVWPGKPDLYHALQATLIPLYQADLSILPAVARGAVYSPKG